MRILLTLAVIAIDLGTAVVACALIGIGVALTAVVLGAAAGVAGLVRG